MSNASNQGNCRLICGIASAIAGLIVILVIRGAMATLAALLIGIALGIILYVVLTRLFCIAARAGAGAATAPSTSAPEPTAPEPAASEPTAPEPAASEPAAPEPAEVAEAARETAEASAEAAPPAAEQGAVAPERPGTQLPGEEELAARKGEWRYEAAADRAEKTAEEKAAEPPAEAPAPAGEGHKPQGLSAPREGGPDDLKLIKGVGPKLQEMLYSMGIYHFDQIAALSPEEIIWLDNNLKGFRGRVTRDKWVEQARILAEGGETEFSRRAREGDVY